MADREATDGTGESGQALRRIPARPRLVLGGAHSCFLDAIGHVACWGGNQFGQLGDPALPEQRLSKRGAPQWVGDLSDVERLSVGSFHSCAIVATGATFCWGHGGFGQLGGDSATPSAWANAAQPRRVAAWSDAVQLALGEGHGCALTARGQVICVGRNGFGQRGDGHIDADDLPGHASVEGEAAGEGAAQLPPVVGLDGQDVLTGVAQLVAGRDHSCARLEDARVACWGANTEGQLGDGSRSEPAGARAVPVVVPGQTDVVEVAAGAGHTCARHRDGSIFCWGRNDSGELGDGAGGAPSDVSLSPVRVALTEGAQGLALGARFSCALMADRTVRCWGYNGFGQLGSGGDEVVKEPRTIAGLTDVVQVAAGARHACALLADGGIRCWGHNHVAQAGGSDETQPSPVSVTLPDAP